MLGYARSSIATFTSATVSTPAHNPLLCFHNGRSLQRHASVHVDSTYCRANTMTHVSVGGNAYTECIPASSTSQHPTSKSSELFSAARVRYLPVNREYNTTNMDLHATSALIRPANFRAARFTSPRSPITVNFTLPVRSGTVSTGVSSKRPNAQLRI